MKITINNQSYQAQFNQTIIEVADQNSIMIPRFCYHKKLSVASNCRMCLVDVKGASKPLPACSTPVQEGMIIDTQSQKTKIAQKNVMQFLLINHPLDCPICDQGGECELQDVAMHFGQIQSDYTESKRVVQNKNIGPLIQTEMTRCIHCTRCIRFGQEIAGIKELGATGRGEHTSIATFIEQSVDSELSGNMIDLCPVGALTSKPFRYSARSWELDERLLIAMHDISGSNMLVHCQDDKVKRVIPNYNPSINDHWLSDRDRFSYQGIYAKSRLTEPKIKLNNQWQTVTWTEAFKYIREKIATFSPDERSQTAGLAGPNLTLEEYYLFQKLIRGLGSNQVEYRLKHNFSESNFLINQLPVLGQSLESIEKMDVIWVIGSFVRKQQPMISQRIKCAAEKGAHIIVLDAQFHDYNYPVKQIILAPHQWTDLCYQVMLDLDYQFKQSAMIYLEDSFKKSARFLARLLYSPDKKSLILLGGDAMNSQYAHALNDAIENIAKLSENRIGYLPNEAGAINAHLAGCVPFRTPTQALKALCGDYQKPFHSSNHHLYFLLNIDPQKDLTNCLQYQEKLEKTKLVVGITSYEHAALQQCADVLLPSGTYFETPGTHVNTEMKWQHFDQTAQHHHNIRAIWKILCMLGKDLTLHDFSYENFNQIHKEIKDYLSVDQIENDNIPNKIEQPIVVKNLQEDEIEVWIPTKAYDVDAMVRESQALQNTKDGINKNAFIHPNTLQKHQMHDGDCICLSFDQRLYEVIVFASDRVAPNCVVIWDRSQKSYIKGPSSGFYKIVKK